MIVPEFAAVLVDHFTPLLIHMRDVAVVEDAVHDLVRRHKQPLVECQFEKRARLEDQIVAVGSGDGDFFVLGEERDLLTLRVVEHRIEDVCERRAVPQQGDAGIIPHLCFGCGERNFRKLALQVGHAVAVGGGF